MVILSKPRSSIMKIMRLESTCVRRDLLRSGVEDDSRRCCLHEGSGDLRYDGVTWGYARVVAWPRRMLEQLALNLFCLGSRRSLKSWCISTVASFSSLCSRKRPLQLKLKHSVCAGSLGAQEHVVKTGHWSVDPGRQSVTLVLAGLDGLEAVKYSQHVTD